MIAQPVYEEQFSNNDIASTKNLLDEMKSVHRVAEAVDSIIIPEIEDEQDDRDYGKFQVVILNNWNGEQNEISIPENYVVSKDSSAQAVDWIDVDYGACDESVNYSKEEQKEDAEEDDVNEEDQEAARNLSWLLNFKATRKNAFTEKTVSKCNECSEKIREGAGASGATISTGPSIQYKKPPFTYTELIEQALRERGELTVSGIYKWISQNFPYYRVDDDRWKNSVRHNLSINPHFSKGGKATKGAGHLWTVVTGDESSRCSWKRRRLEQFVSERRRREAASLDQHTHREAHDAASFIAGGHDEDTPPDDTTLYPRQQMTTNSTKQ
ncbi:hypothetical protein B566_EDAN008197 [Ephemera danica]|nr:hypothetical protein B566_EDAN008197 [Ephemera danica]